MTPPRGPIAYSLGAGGLVFYSSGHDQKQLRRRLRRLGSQRGVVVRFDEERGKGSHGTLYFGDRITVFKDRRAEIRPSLLHAMLRQLGLSERDLR